MTVSDLYDQPQILGALAEKAGRDRFGCLDRSLTLAQIVRESTAALTTSAIYTWSCQRRLLDLSAANVTLRDGPIALVTSVHSPRVAVLADDPLAKSEDAGDAVEVVDEETMFTRLLEDVIGLPQPRPARNEPSNRDSLTNTVKRSKPQPRPARNEPSNRDSLTNTVKRSKAQPRPARNEPSNGGGDVSPGSQPRPVAAVTAIIHTARRLETMGDRHLWGTVAAAVAGGLTKASHVVGVRADDDRERVFAARPDLARLVELVAVSDATGEPLTFPVRRTCCLLYKLPQGVRCATCSLSEREKQIAELTAWHLQARADTRRDQPGAGS